MMNCLVQIGEEYFKSLHIDTAFGGKGIVKLNTNPNVATAMRFTDYSQAAALVSLVTSLKTYENEVIKIVPEF